MVADHKAETATNRAEIDLIQGILAAQVREGEKRLSACNKA